MIGSTGPIGPFSGRVADVASAKVGLILTMLLSLSFLMVGLVRLTAMGERDNAVYSGLIWLFAITLLALYEGIGGIKGLKHTGLIGNFP